MYSPQIDDILKKLDYKKDNVSYVNNLLNLEQISSNNNISFHHKNVLKELKPSAVYFIDNKPFVLFFECINSLKINKKIWNAQIPIAIFCSEGDIKVFNGMHYCKENNNIDFNLKELTTKEEDISYWNVLDSNFLKNLNSQYEKNVLNELLLDNIKTTIDYLKRNDVSSKLATRLLIRIIFIRFLIDRGVNLGSNILKHDNNIETVQSNLTNVIRNKENLYLLFEELRKSFNGNLFIEDKDENNISDNIFHSLAQFISGSADMQKHQPLLFPIYDFSIIPVELISNVYESILGEDKQKDDKAFYTPYNLVDYILKNTVDKYLIGEKKSCSVLDPSCGSGIFLVESYRRIVEKNLTDSKKEYFDDNEKLIKLLEDNIYGVDKNEEAIDVTIFSLYLSLLDYKDPKTLVGIKLPSLKYTNLIVSDFFDDIKIEIIKNRHFDFIIGNPPWGNVKEKLHIKYCKDNNLPQANNEISRSFVYKCKELLNDKTTCCLILPAKILYNIEKPAIEYRRWILENTEIKKIIELSSVRKQVFKGATAPASIITFKLSNDNSFNNKIEYISIKPNIYFKLFKMLVIEKNDIKYIEQWFLYNNDWAWKTIVYGSSWDFEIIKKLKNRYRTIEFKLKEIPSIVSEVGLECDAGDRRDSSFYIGIPILNSRKSLTHFYIDSSKTTIFDKKEIHRPKYKELFEPPSCLFTRGVNSNNYKMRSVYYNKNYLLFRDSIYIIKGENKDSYILQVLTGLFNSSFYVYLNLMLASSIGIEREKVMIKCLKSFPFPNDENLDAISTLVDKIQYFKKNEMDNPILNNCIIKLDELILDIFELKDNVFIDYALTVQIPQLTSKDFSYRKVKNEELEKYSKIFINYFESVYKQYNKNIKIVFYKFKNYIVFELILSSENVDQVINYENMENIDDKLKKYIKLALYKTNDMFYNIKDIIYFDDESFSIIKTNEYKNWHPAIAEIDLSSVIDDIMINDGNKEE